MNMGVLMGAYGYHHYVEREPKSAELFLSVLKRMMEIWVEKPKLTDEEKDTGVALITILAESVMACSNFKETADEDIEPMIRKFLLKYRAAYADLLIRRGDAVRKLFGDVPGSINTESV